MKYNTDNLRIAASALIMPSNELIEQYPLNESGSTCIFQARDVIKNIIQGRDKRLMIVVGPCSIHDTKAAREYAEKLSVIKKELADDLFIVMRVYFEKPRTTVGWKGLINDPDLDESFNINKGLKIARHLLVDLANMKMPVAVEYLDLITPQYIADLVSWGAIGARTTESQSHRELASGLSCPVGFKNGTTGSFKVAIDAIKSASSSHHFLSVNKQGRASHYTSLGNDTAHIILRGGSNGTNYDEKSIKQVCDGLADEGLTAKVMVDFSHANSQKQFKNQILVAQNVAQQISNGSDKIFGVMIESHLNEGKQNIDSLDLLQYGVSVTDGCLGWDNTQTLLYSLAKAVREKVHN